MLTIYWMVLGVLSFAAGTAILGAWLRRHPSAANAEKSSRIMHFLFFAGLGIPGLVALFHPGLSHVDSLLGLKPLPWKTFFLVLGIVVALPGVYLVAISNRLLRALGSGANAFRLTKRIVEDDIYKRTRNPMSLGYYLCALALGFVADSTFISLGALLGAIPAHIFFLKYFEEKELELRFGEAYLRYKRSVPFLLPRISIKQGTDA